MEVSCSSIGCEKKAEYDSLCRSCYYHQMKLVEYYRAYLEAKTIAESALKIGLEECERLRDENREKALVESAKEKVRKIVNEGCCMIVGCSESPKYSGKCPEHYWEAYAESADNLAYYWTIRALEAEMIANAAMAAGLDECNSLREEITVLEKDHEWYVEMTT